MLFIVEGVDRTGKTSLCERLADAHDGIVLHFAAPRREAIAEYVEPLMTYQLFPGPPHLFIDRHYLGEGVWPVFFGREPRMTAAECLCIELFLKSLGALCVLAWRDEDELERACRDEPCAGRAGEAQRMFDYATQSSTLHWHRYEHGDDVSALIDEARRLELNATLR